MKNGLQRFGKFLSAMVMPNIGAFIAWGFITALFIADLSLIHISGNACCGNDQYIFRDHGSIFID